MNTRQKNILESWHQVLWNFTKREWFSLFLWSGLGVLAVESVDPLLRDHSFQRYLLSKYKTIIDEGDSLAASRHNQQSHHEDKVAVNTLIQKIDDARRSGGRVLVFLCTNRFASLDPAIVSRAGHTEEFLRSNDQER